MARKKKSAECQDLTAWVSFGEEPGTSVLEDWPEKSNLNHDQGSESITDPEALASVSTQSPDGFDMNTPQSPQYEEVSGHMDTLRTHEFPNSLQFEYHSPIIHIYVGDKPICFFVHNAVLAQFPVLARNCNLVDGIQTITLPEVSPQLFELLVRYAYTGQYQSDFLVGNGKVDGTNFRTHALLYCLSRKFGLWDLAEKTTREIESIGKFDFRYVTEIAREVYPKLRDDDIWFTGFFKNEAGRAMIENKKLIQEPWILSIFRDDGGRLAVDLFTTLIASSLSSSAIIVEEFVASKSLSQPVLDKEENSHCANCAQRLESLEKKKIEPDVPPESQFAVEACATKDVPADEPQSKFDWDFSAAQKAENPDETDAAEVKNTNEPADSGESTQAAESWGINLDTSAEAPREALGLQTCTYAEEPQVDAPDVSEIDSWGTWGGFSKKSKAEKKKRHEIDWTVWGQAPVEDMPVDETLPDGAVAESVEAEGVKQAEIAGVSEAEPYSVHCRFRLEHFAHEKQWSQCAMCRQELSALALRMLPEGSCG